MAERRSKWDLPGSGSPAPPGSEASPPRAPPSEAAAAAAAAAAKIAAQFAPQRPKLEERSDSNERRERGDPEFVHDIEINDQRNRYMLTKGQTQQQLHRETGASVTTKGTWYPDKTLATKDDPPLYLHVTALTREILDAAVSKIEELMAQEMPQLVEDRHQKRLEWEAQRPPPREREKRRWPEEKVYLNLESLRNFNLRAKVVGPGGLFVKYIQGETQTRVQIKGVGSGFIDHETGRESDEPMHIHITGPDEAMIAKAKELAEDLLDAVRTEWGKARAALEGGGFGPPGGPGGPGGPRGGPGYGNGPYPPQQGHGQWDQGYGAYPPQPAGGAAPPPDGAPPPPPPEDDAPPPPPPDADPRGGAHGGYYGAPQNGYGAAGYGSRGADPYSARAGSSGAGPAAGSPATGYGGGYGGAPSAATPAAAAAPTPEEAALDKYWRDYITWEDQFKSYHQRVPTREEGAQDVPPQYRSGRSGAGGAPPSGGEERRDGSGRYGGVPPPR